MYNIQTDTFSALPQIGFFETKAAIDFLTSDTLGPKLLKSANGKYFISVATYSPQSSLSYAIFVYFYKCSYILP